MTTRADGRRRRRALVIATIAAIAWSVTACDSDEPAAEESTTTAASTTMPPVESPTTTAALVTTPATTSPATSPATSPTVTTVASTPAGTTAPPCATFSSESVTVGYPMTLSGLVGEDIRTGRHDCFERVVLELAGTGDFPGYRVEYVDDPVRLSPSDLEVDIAGDATLVLSIGSWMTNTEGVGYDGPDMIVPDNTSAVVELRLIEDFEGLSAWAIGVDEQRPFRVTTLLDPPRIVIDIAT